LEPGRGPGGVHDLWRAVRDRARRDGEFSPGLEHRDRGRRGRHRPGGSAARQGAYRPGRAIRRRPPRVVDARQHSGGDRRSDLRPVLRLGRLVAYCAKTAIPSGVGTYTRLFAGSTATECAPVPVGRFAIHLLEPASITPRTGVFLPSFMPLEVMLLAAR